jgi:tetratricopeptide (TPR) repeat protein
VRLITLAAAAACIVSWIGCSSSPEEKAARFLRLGKKYIEQKQYERATLELQNALRLKPKDPEIHYQLGLASLAQDDPGLAVRHLRIAADGNPQNKHAQLKLAELLLRTADPQLLRDAEQRSLAVLQTAPDLPDALQVLAVAKWRLGKPNEAVQYLERALSRSPAHLKSAISLAAIHVEARRFADAETVLTRLAGNSPQSSDALVALGRFYLMASRPKEAEAQFVRAFRMDPKNGPAMFEAARLQIALGRRHDAERTLRALSALPESSYKALHAMFLFESGQRDAALGELERLHHEFPDNREVRSRLVDVYLAVKRTQDALNVLTTALEKNPSDTEAREQRGRIFAERGDLAGAEADFLQAIRTQPLSAQTHYQLAQVRRRQRQPFTYRQELEMALKLDADLLPARIELSQYLRGRAGNRTALQLLNETPQHQKLELPTIIERNWVLLSLGEAAEVRRGVDAGLAQSRNPALVLQDGLLKLREGRLEGARASFEETLRADPENLHALEALAASFEIEKRGQASLERVRRHAAEHARSARIQHFLGNWLEKAGDRQSAKAAYAAATAADASFLQSQIATVRLDLMDGRWDEARSSLGRVFRTDGRNPDGLLALAMLEEETGNYPAAIAAYRRLLEVEPAHVTAMNNLAFRLTEEGKELDEALKLAQQVKEQVPDDPAVEDTIGWIFYKKGLYSIAVGHLENAVAKQRTARRSYHLAMAYSQSGRRREAEKTLEAALKMDPDLPEAQAARQLLSSAR